MAIKSDRWIRNMALEHDMINPFNDRQVRDGVISYGVSSYGYDLRVADKFKIFTNVNSAIVDPKNFDQRSFIDVKGPSVLIPPNSFALARSVEYFKIPRDVLTICVGKSTYARCGIIVNVTPFEPDGKALSRSKSPTARRCPPRSIPMKACARSSSSRATSRATSATKTKQGSTRSSRASCCRNCEERHSDLYRLFSFSRPGDH